MNKIENWINKKCGEIIFDSNIDNWNKSTSVFVSKVMNKNQLLFLIETTNGIKFGQYVNTTIDKVDSWISDENSFLFTFLNQNKPLKFKLKRGESCVFYLYPKTDDYLFSISNDIFIYKKGKESKCYDTEYCYFNYEGNKNAIIGGNESPVSFTPKRILVIQMK